MKNNKRYRCSFGRASFLFTLLFSCVVLPHGFGGDTLVRVGGDIGFWSIEQTATLVGEGKKQYVASYDTDSFQRVTKRIQSAGVSEANCYCKLSFDESTQCTIFAVRRRNIFIEFLIGNGLLHTSSRLETHCCVRIITALTG